MNLDELQSVQARERQSSDLQHLRSSFYREVGEYIQTLNEKRAQAVESADDPFAEPEVRRLTDDIETAEGTVEAIYERRVGKVVKKASIAAAGMSVEDDGLTNEEEALFEDLVTRIEDNRETILSILDGDVPSVSCSIDDETTDISEQSPDLGGNPSESQHPPEPENASGGEDSPTTGGVNAADLMGDASRTDSGASTSDVPPESAPPSEAAPSTSDVPPEPTPPSDATSSTSETVSDGEASRERTSRDDEATVNVSSPSSTRDEKETRDVPGLPRTTVRITADIGEIVGADDRDYDLGAEDVVTLPEPNADVLVEKNAAERLQ